MLGLEQKLSILSDAAKYDVSCASSGSKRNNKEKGLGNSSGMGICHSYTQDGRCVSLLKILLSNVCIYDCIYCVSRRSNDNQKTAFTVKEVVSLTIDFYRRNYIEGLFLSSGIFKNADYTMERLVRVAKELRLTHNFNGYIHLKTIPGASHEILEEAGRYADRLSVNIEIPSEESLTKLAPEKSYAQVYGPMSLISEKIAETKIMKTTNKVSSNTNFVPAGQSTQMIVGASPESDLNILKLANDLYKDYSLKRVYYSAYVPISPDNRLPDSCQSFMVRENRLYQADWLMREYGFSYSDLVHDKKKQLDTDIDPKLSFALDNIALFPVEVNKADYQLLLRVPGIGLKSAKRIIETRKYHTLSFDDLKLIGVILQKAKYFIICSGKKLFGKELSPEHIKLKIVGHNSLGNSQLQLIY